MSGLSRKKSYKRKRGKKGSDERNKKRRAKMARRGKRPSQSAKVLKQKQDEARAAIRMARELSSPFSRLSLEVPINTDPVKRIKA